MQNISHIFRDLNKALVLILQGWVSLSLWDIWVELDVLQGLIRLAVQVFYANGFTCITI